MTRPNRVAPTGEIAALPQRGLLMGNRGILHDDAGDLRAAWRHWNWVCCVTEYKGRRRTLMQPGHYTELFFLDEAVALAAGHRPCALCRREAQVRFMDAWQEAFAERPLSKEVDRAMHAARIERRRQRRHEAEAEGLPDGTFVLLDEGACLLAGDRAVPFGPAGYGPPLPRPRGGVTVLTPAPVVSVMRAGYVPVLHPDAGGG